MLADLGARVGSASWAPTWPAWSGKFALATTGKRKQNSSQSRDAKLEMNKLILRRIPGATTN